MPMQGGVRVEARQAPMPMSVPRPPWQRGIRFVRAPPPNLSRSSRMTHADLYKKPGTQPNMTLDGRNSNATPREKDASNERDKSTTRDAITQVNMHAALCARGEDSCPVVVVLFAL